MGYTDTGKKGAITNLMMDIVEREKQIQRNRISELRRPLDQRPMKMEWPHDPDRNKTKLKHCLLTTLPAHRLPKSLAEACGNMHHVHLHDSENPVDRVPMRRPGVRVAFGVQSSKEPPGPDLVTPAPGYYAEAHDVEWNKKTFNVNYLLDFADYV